MVDRETLDGLLATTDAEFVGELIDAYLEDSPGLIAGMRQALAAGNAIEFTRAAHSLKSSSASLGAMGLSALAKELEGMGKQSKLDGAAPLIEQLAGAFSQVEQALQAFQSEP